MPWSYACQYFAVVAIKDAGVVEAPLPFDIVDVDDIFIAHLKTLSAEEFTPKLELVVKRYALRWVSLPPKAAVLHGTEESFKLQPKKHGKKTAWTRFNT